MSFDLCYLLTIQGVKKAKNVVNETSSVASLSLVAFLAVGIINVWVNPYFKNVITCNLIKYISFLSISGEHSSQSYFLMIIYSLYITELVLSFIDPSFLCFTGL